MLVGLVGWGRCWWCRLQARERAWVWPPGGAGLNCGPDSRVENRSCRALKQ